MVLVDSTDQQRQAFAEALRRQLVGRSRDDLARQITKLSGESTSAQAMGHWLTGAAEPTRAKVYALEKVLAMKPGALSRLLGYLPVEAQAARTVAQAIESDPALTEDQRKMLLAAYRAATR